MTIVKGSRSTELFRLALRAPLSALRFPLLTLVRRHWTIRLRGFSRLESYVRFPVPQITTFLLLVHTAFGCCLHHAHACEDNCCSEPSARAESCQCDAHQDDELAEKSTSAVGSFTAGGDHHEQHQCAGDDCTFVHTQLAPEEFDGSAAHAWPLDIVVAVDSSRAHLDRSFDQRLAFAGTSLRRHLVLRVLLI